MNQKQMKRPTFCFATMCKNEEHCIRETLESVYKYCDYWVVCDTGSTDNTCKIIRDFFTEKNIPGELFIDDWIGFGPNKTLLFQRCYKKTDYIIHCDADDLLMGDFDFNTEDAGHLAYAVNMKRGSCVYTNLVIFNNTYKWKICGVAHTYAKCLDNINNLETYNFSHKNFYILSRDTGARSNDALKFHKDATILQKQFFDTLVFDEDSLNSRSVFYAAQSYFDSHNIEEALKWYCLYIKLKSFWDEEVFESYLRIASCFSTLQERESPDKTSVSESLENTTPEEEIIKKYKYHHHIVKYLNLAMKQFDDRAEPYYELGKYYLSIGLCYKSYIHLRIAENKNYDMVREKYSLFVNKIAYGPHIIE